jgi:hypothetical protein
LVAFGTRRIVVKGDRKTYAWRNLGVSSRENGAMNATKR